MVDRTGKTVLIRNVSEGGCVMFDTKIYSPPSFVTFIMPKATLKQQPAPVKQDLQIHFTDLQELISMQPAPQSVAKQEVQQSAQPAPQPAAKQEIKQTTQPVPQPAAKQEVKQTAQSVPKSVAKQEIKQTAQSAPKPAAKQEVGQPAKPAVQNPIPYSDSAMRQHFKENGLTVEQMNHPACGATMHLVNAIQSSLPDAEQFLHYVRDGIANKNGEFFYKCKVMPEEQRRKIHDLVLCMKACGCFAELKHNDWLNGGSITGKVAYEPNIRNFLTGIWLEHYCQLHAEPVIRKFAEAHGLPYSLADNVILQNSKGERHEIDLLFSIGDKVFGTEQKSGSNFYQFDQYRGLAEWLGLPQEQFMLIRADQKDAYSIQCAQYLFRFYICDTEHFEKQLLAMIEHAFSQE